ncbi:hypothetical protein RUM43_000543 [Polyplax serrata]|uniref:Uncharacterized protein n=1 Tax=Polyplax serrata TaxID=468196 RepID=A0AAN8XQK3_POLSC
MGTFQWHQCGKLTVLSRDIFKNEKGTGFKSKIDYRLVMITDKVVEVVVTFSLSAYKEFPIGGNREVYDPEPRPWPHKPGTSRAVLPGFLYLEDSGSS